MTDNKKNPAGNVPRQHDDEPRGDLGGEKTWEPPEGEQGISNRADDEDAEEDQADS